MHGTSIKIFVSMFLSCCHNPHLLEVSWNESCNNIVIDDEQWIKSNSANKQTHLIQIYEHSNSMDFRQQDNKGFKNHHKKHLVVFVSANLIAVYNTEYRSCDPLPKSKDLSLSPLPQSWRCSLHIRGTAHTSDRAKL